MSHGAMDEIERLEQALADERQRTERAEADNAELMRALHRAHGWASANGLRSVAEDMVKPLARPHPGAALLERMRALEEAWALTRTLFEDLAENGYGADAPFTSQEEAARVLALVDALKVPRE